MTVTPPTSPAGAVFLSYAREDSTAVRGIADALRAAGIEVWFDQNELVGGDAWDRKIRSQIKECALFLPVVSASTNARIEGYFRLEWLLAVERSRLMADDKAFLVPVVIDATTEAAAKVPDKFRDVQWTRLTGGETSPAFVARVQKLLGSSAVGPVVDRAPGQRPGLHPTPAAKSGQPSWTWPAVAVLAIGVAAFFLARKSEQPTAPPKLLTEIKPAAEAKTVTPTPPLSLAPLAPEKSVAVLPFENLSPDKDNAFFADGVHEDVITSLTKIRDLKVIGRTSVLSYRDPATRNHKQIAADLGVATLLEGTVRRAGTKVRVTAQLINARTDESIWAETYDVDLTDAFTIQSALAQNITAALKANFTTGERAYVAERPTQNLEAYDLFLRARAIIESGAVVGGARALAPMEQAISLLEQAVAKDPGFAAAYSQLGYLNGRMYWYAYLDPTEARRERVKVARDAALRLAPGKPETHLAVGAYLYYCENNWTGALAEYRAAAAVLPNDAQLTLFIGLCLRRLGALQDSATYFARSMELNPRDSVCAEQRLQVLHALRRFPEVGELSARYVPLFPDNSVIPQFIWRARLELDHDQAAYNREILKTYGRAIPGIGGDLPTRERDLAASVLKVVPGPGSVVNDPISLPRARVAFLLGKREVARGFAEEAITFYREQKWNPRQQGFVMLGTAMAHAIAGRSEEAIRLGKEGFEWQTVRDHYLESDAREILSNVFLVLDRRDVAFALLREMMTLPCKTGPEELRLDPFWARVKDDPRFEEYLKLAKPL